MNPAVSRVGTVSFPSFWPKAMPASNVSSLVVTQRMTSSSFMT